MEIVVGVVTKRLAAVAAVAVVAVL